MATESYNACEHGDMRGESFIERWFPVPRMLVPRTSGIDVSDSSIKMLTLKRGVHGFEVDSFGAGPLAPGVVVNGVVQDPVALGAALRALREEAGAPRNAHLALPEEKAYVFTMHVHDVADEKNVHAMIEFEFEGRVPLKPAQAIYDYDVLEVQGDGTGAEIAVTVFPRDVVEGYMHACLAGGITPVSFEIEARSIARSIVPRGARQAALVVDFGRARTGIAILKGEIPIFTTTVAVGGDTITEVLVKGLKITEPEAESIKNTQGIFVGDGSDKNVTEVISGTAAALADEVVRHYQYWDSRRDEHGERATPIRNVLLTGGSSNLRGLPEYISGRVKAPTVRVDVWQNVCSFDTYVPSITENHALGLATVIGLALRGAL